MTTRVLPAVMLLGLAGFVLSGCGGGASAKPTVRYLPAQTAAPGGAAKEATAATATAAATETGGSGVGNLKGRVVYQGGDIKLPPLYAQGAAPKDPTVCGAEATPDQTIVVNNGGLANVFIYLPKPPKGELPAVPTEPAIFDQKFCVFKPHTLTMRTGQKVKVLNSDPALHNTHTNPKRNTTFNQGIAPNSESELVYTKPETQPLMVVCDIHAWMKAYHLPVDHPFAVVSGPDGAFEIKDLPSGKHEFKVWHEKGGELQKALAVTIKPNETTEIEIPVGAAKLARFEGPRPDVIQLSSLGEISTTKIQNPK